MLFAVYVPIMPLNEVNEFYCLEPVQVQLPYIGKYSPAS